MSPNPPTKQPKVAQKWYKTKSLVAFTLAEVLIVIGLIGIVAEMTIPSMVYSVEKQIIATKVKMAYSILSQATELINLDCNGDLFNCTSYPCNAEEGGSSCVFPSDADDTEQLEIKNLYKGKLSIIKDCPDETATGCFSNDFYYLNNQPNVWSDPVPEILLNNGIALSFYWNTSSFVCEVDINGPQKPNTFGKDLFSFNYDRNKKNIHATRNDEIYAGNFDDCKSLDDPEYNYDDQYGIACTDKIILKGLIDYY